MYIYRLKRKRSSLIFFVSIALHNLIFVSSLVFALLFSISLISVYVKQKFRKFISQLRQLIIISTVEIKSAKTTSLAAFPM